MLIRNAQLYIGNHFENGLSVRLKGGRIAEVGEGLEAEAGEPEIDLAGDFLLPGFVDVHIHAFG